MCAAGNVSAGLHELAKDRDADLIVTGSSHRGPLGRILNGDDARATLHGVPCAVAIAPRGYAENAKAITRIGLGFDGSPESARALATARELADRHRAHLTAMSVAWVPPASTADSSIDENPSEVWRRTREQIRRLAGAGQIDEDISYGDADTALARFSEGLGPGLLVVGSRGRGLLVRVVNGSTSDYLARHVHCPLLVLPREAATPRHVTADENPATADDYGG